MKQTGTFNFKSTDNGLIDNDKFEQKKTFFIFDYPLMHFQQIVIQFS